MADCGSCTMCCKLFAISEPGFEKEINVWCKHCNPRKGCNIYPDRPQLCKDYQCLWLQTQEGEQALPAELQPHRCKIIFDTNATGNMLVARVDPNYRGAEKAPAVRKLMERMRDQGIITYIICGETRQIFGREDDEQFLRLVEDGITFKEESTGDQT